MTQTNQLDTICSPNFRCLREDSIETTVGACKLMSHEKEMGSVLSDERTA